MGGLRVFFFRLLGPDADGGRRWPWATIAILVVCVFAQILLGRSRAEGEIYAAEQAAGLLDYHARHPYLELPADVERLYGTPTPRADVEAPPTFQRRRQQAELERRARHWRSARGSSALLSWGLVPSALEPSTLVSYMFVHAGLLAMAVNLFFLWLAGPPLEAAWGRPLFLFFYLGSGVFGALLWATREPQTSVPLVGAAIAVAAVMGAFAVRYGAASVPLSYGFFWPFPPTVRSGVLTLPGWLFVGLWLPRELAGAAVDAVSGTTVWVRAAAFGLGAGVAALIGYLGIEKRRRRRRPAAPGTLENPAVERAHQLVQGGRLEQAWEVLRDELRQDPDNLEAAFASWDVAVARGRASDAAADFLRYLRAELRRGERELALHHWRELSEQAGAVEIEPELRVQLAEAMLDEDRGDEAADLLAAVPDEPEGLPLGTRIRLARAAAQARSSSTAALCEPLLEHPDLPGPLRRELEALFESARAAGLRPPPGAPEEPIPLAEPQETPRELEVIAAVPQRLEEEKLALEAVSYGELLLPLARVRAVAVAEIAGRAGTWVVIDLLTDALAGPRTRVRSVRLDSRDFDPRELLLETGDRQQALAAFLEHLLTASGAEPLPSPDAARGRPFARFPSLAEYERRAIGLSATRAPR